MTRDELKAKADELEITYAPNVKTEKLAELVAEKTGEPIDVPAPVVKEDKAVKAEVVNDYFVGHPRREIKLRGLLTTVPFENVEERRKIMRMIDDIRAGY